MIIEKYNKKKNVKYNKKYEKSRERQGEIWSEKVLDIFWPSICPFCGKVNRGGVCPLCRKAVEKLEIHEPRCLKCGKPIRCEEREFCHDCYNTEHIYERGVSVWLHKPPVNQAIYQLKYHNQRYVAKYFAQEICIKYAEEIGKILGIPVVANLVKRVHYTGYQKKLDPIGRKKNLEHAFAPGGDPDRLPTDFRRVIIIDDIYTTGNTVDQVAKVLKTMGLQKVYFLTISIGQGY